MLKCSLFVLTLLHIAAFCGMAIQNRVTVNLEEADAIALKEISESTGLSLAYLGRVAIKRLIHQRENTSRSPLAIDSIANRTLVD